MLSYYSRELGLYRARAAAAAADPDRNELPRARPLARAAADGKSTTTVDNSSCENLEEGEGMERRNEFKTKKKKKRGRNERRDNGEKSGKTEGSLISSVRKKRARAFDGFFLRRGKGRDLEGS